MFVCVRVTSHCSEACARARVCVCVCVCVLPDIAMICSVDVEAHSVSLNSTPLGPFPRHRHPYSPQCYSNMRLGAELDHQMERANGGAERAREEAQEAR